MIHTTVNEKLNIFRQVRAGLVQHHGIAEDIAEGWARVAAMDYAHAMRTGNGTPPYNYYNGMRLQYYAGQAAKGMPALRFRRPYAFGGAKSAAKRTDGTNA